MPVRTMTPSARFAARRFSLGGVIGAKGEFQLVCAVHNLVKLWRTGVAIVREASADREPAYA